MSTIRIGRHSFFPGHGLQRHSAAGKRRAAPGRSLRKGTVEMGVIGGSTLPVSLFRARANRRLTMTSFDIGRVMAGRSDGRIRRPLRNAGRT